MCFKLGLGCLMEMTLREGGVSAASLVLVLVCARQNSSARDGVAVWPRVSNTVRRIWTHPLNRNQFQRKAGYHLPLPWNSHATMTHNKEIATNLVQDLLVGLWQCHFLFEMVAFLLQLHTLSPIIESAGHVHFVSRVGPGEVIFVSGSLWRRCRIRRWDFG